MTTYLKKELEGAGFKVDEPVEGLLSIENFLTKQELDDLFSIINNATEEDWNIEYLGSLKNFCLQKFGRDDVENLVKEGKYEITSNWADKNLNMSSHQWTQSFFHRLNDLVLKNNPKLWLSGFKTFQRMQQGVELKSHGDQTTDPSVQYAAIVYLNDDYVDGEFFLENKNIELKPKPGTLLIFPGNIEFEHGVRVVGNGPIRYVIVGFIKITDFYNNNKY